MIGRTKEIEELNRLYESDESEFVAVYGRRRVGKTYLVRETFSDRYAFHHTGLPNATKHQQLVHFKESLVAAGARVKTPRNWFEAFHALREVVARSAFRRKVVFIDELPWMDTAKSDFLMALETFWNEWASARKDIVLIVCGSAAAWMVKNLFRNRGGLHNRVTARICLQPFTLGECEMFAAERGLGMSRANIAECYMALGGIPYYWRYLARGISLAQNLDRLCFAVDAPLKGEFDELYSSLFRDAISYKKVVAALAKKKVGMTRLELIEALDISTTGRLSEILKTLEASGFIRSYRSYGSLRRRLQTSTSGLQPCRPRRRPHGADLPSSACAFCICLKSGGRSAWAAYMSRPTDGVSRVTRRIRTVSRSILCLSARTTSSTSAR